MPFSDFDFLEKNFIHYAKEDTQSKYANKDQVPTTPNQVKMMKELADQVKDYGLESYYNEKTAFAIGHLAANTAGVAPIGFSPMWTRLNLTTASPSAPKSTGTTRGKSWPWMKRTAFSWTRKNFLTC